MYSSVLLIGGGFMFNGAAAALQSRLQAKLPPLHRKLVDQVEVIARPKVKNVLVTIVEKCNKVFTFLLSDVFREWCKFVRTFWFLIQHFQTLIFFWLWKKKLQSSCLSFLPSRQSGLFLPYWTIRTQSGFLLPLFEKKSENVLNLVRKLLWNDPEFVWAGILNITIFTHFSFCFFDRKWIHGQFVGKVVQCLAS